MALRRVYGLLTATKEEIDELKLRFPRGSHVTHLRNGTKLPYNGVFYTYPKTIPHWLKATNLN